METWRFIAGFDYEVSDRGRVRSWRGRKHRRSVPRLLALRPGSNGYMRVTLCRDGEKVERMVHHLVLEAFVGLCPEGRECRHFPDSARSNNALTNLSWGTKQENQQDKAVHGSIPVGDRHWTKQKQASIARGERHGHAKLTRENARAILEMRDERPRPTQRAVAARFSVSRELVGLIWRGRIWQELQGAESAA